MTGTYTRPVTRGRPAAPADAPTGTGWRARMMMLTVTGQLAHAELVLLVPVIRADLAPIADVYASGDEHAAWRLAYDLAAEVAREHLTERDRPCGA